MDTLIKYLHFLVALLWIAESLSIGEVEDHGAAGIAGE